MTELLALILSGPKEFLGTLLLMVWAAACSSIVVSQVGTSLTTIVTTLEVYRAGKVDKKE